MIVAMLADQKKGESVGLSDDKKTWFPVGKRYEENVLLSAFSQGVTRRGEVLSDLASDRFNEEDETVGLDQLLMIRLAQQLKAAPDKMRGRDAGPSPINAPSPSKRRRIFPRTFAASRAHTPPGTAIRSGRDAGVLYCHRSDDHSY